MENMKYKRMACQLKVGEHIILPNSQGEDIGLIKKVLPDKFGQYYDVTFDNLTTEERDITFTYDWQIEVLTQEEFKREYPFELVEPAEENLEGFRNLLKKFGLEIEAEGITLINNRHFQVKTAKNYGMENEDKIRRSLIEFVDPVAAAIRKWETENGIPVTFNFGISKSGEITAGLDLQQKAVIKLPERIKNISLENSAKDILSQDENVELTPDDIEKLVKSNLNLYVNTNLGDTPLEDYLDISAMQSGFDDYADMRSNRVSLRIKVHSIIQKESLAQKLDQAEAKVNLQEKSQGNLHQQER